MRKEVTLPNIRINVPENASETRFFSWNRSGLENIILKNELRKEEDRIHLILTSETVCNVENQEKLVSILRNFVKVGGGIFVAAKTFY